MMFMLLCQLVGVMCDTVIRIIEFLGRTLTQVQLSFFVGIS